MCWTKNYFPSLKVAEDDIPVKKLLEEHDGTLCSPFMSGFKWTIGEEVKSDLEEQSFSEMRGKWVINVCLHSLHEAREMRSERYYLSSYAFYCKNQFIAPSTGTLFPYDAIIPKGAKYYVNEYGEYVSDRLKIIGKTELI